ncbi:MAG TPA: T9SS type A sorting domain-containing protein [Rubricoccaceae bacterium]|nr:T9SS type A sorting domain-containing protein [Rubricoccaceae bacterium]
MPTRPWLPALATLLLLLGACAPNDDARVSGGAPEEEAGPSGAPDDWFWQQRAYPFDEINYAAYREARAQALALRAEASARGALPWEFAGPTNIGGRVTDIAAHPASPSTYFVATATGGVFKTLDNGATFAPVGEDYLSLSIGALAIDPQTPQRLYVGTGESNGGGGSLTYGGSGVFRSPDGGLQWVSLGLEETSTIGRIVVHPTDPNTIWVAAAGKLFSTDEHRGIYRTTDGGATWDRTLFVNDSTGAVDVAINPQDPSVVYAATWERIRRPHHRHFGGDGSGLWRSTDGGVTWTELTNGLPSGFDVGRIGVAVSASSPNVVYAIYADQSGDFLGVYRSANGGDTWARTNDGSLSSMYATFGWWFGNVRVDPTNPDVAYVLGLDVYKTTNGGASWSYASGSMHVDQHALWIDPTNPSRLLAGNDGGVYHSSNAGASWAKPPGGFPVTQFYTSEIDATQPQRLYGGTQDNGTNRTLTGNLNDWHSIYGGDGFVVRVDPTNNQFVYAESQYGGFGRSTNGGASFIPGRPGTSGRANWMTPYELSPQNPATLILGTDRVFRSTNRGASWTAISPDLTEGPGPGNLVFGTITTLAFAPSDDQTIYAGTDDGHVWVTRNGGGAWQEITAGLPDRWITKVAVHPANPEIAYVTLSGYRQADYLPHVFRTDNAGATWTDRSSNLPEAPVNDLVIDPVSSDRLFVGSDVGVFYSDDAGLTWAALGTDLPMVPVMDLTLHARQLVAGTYGRSMYRYDLSTLPSTAGPEAMPEAFQVTASPNPARGAVQVRFSLDTPGRVRAAVYDLAGRRVAVLADETRGAGVHALRWDAARVAAGTYLIRVEAGARVATTRVAAVR